MSELIGDLVGLCVEVVYSLGYAGLFLLSVLSNALFPIPSEVYLPLAGYLAGDGQFSLWLVMFVCTCGAVVGSLVVYAVGGWLGRKRLRRLVRAYGRFVLIKEEDLDRAEGWFDAHRGRAVFFGRLVPGLGGLISIPAGIRRMPLPTFIFYTSLGCAVWNGVFVSLGWLLGQNWSAVKEYSALLQYPVYAALILAASIFLYIRLRHNRRKSA